MNLNNVLKMAQLIHSLQQVKRATFANGEERKENDAEHQYQLALVAWYIIESEHLTLDKNLVIQYALVHDVVEAYAGDTYFYGNRDGKEEREHQARERLLQEFGEFESMHTLLKKYEEQTDLESKFVYALDKLLPILNIYLDSGRSWKECHVTRDMIYANKAKIVSKSLEIKDYFEQLMVILKEKEPELFG